MLDITTWTFAHTIHLVYLIIIFSCSLFRRFCAFSNNLLSLPFMNRFCTLPLMSHLANHSLLISSLCVLSSRDFQPPFSPTSMQIRYTSCPLPPIIDLILSLLAPVALVTSILYDLSSNRQISSNYLLIILIR